MSNITWNGRELTSFVKNNKTASYSYNADGIRTSYTYNGETVDYILDGTTILGEVRTDSDNNKEYIYYYYDESGEVTGLNYLGNDYYYIKNLQGDVMYITDDTGEIVVTYLYDAWGNILQVLDDSWDYVGDVNPFTYRSYYYAFETGLYYLQSRYYDPQTGRFLNADDTNYLGASGTTLGFNLYAYCENNPVNYIDFLGYAKISYSTIKRLVEALIGVQKAISFNRAWGQVLAAIKPMWYPFTLFLKALPVYGWIILGVVTAIGAIVLTTVAIAYVNKKSIYFGFNGWKPYFYYA